MELHHHIETSSTRLLHTIETRTERLGDEVVRGFEGLGDAQREATREVCKRVEDGWKIAKREIVGVGEEGRKGREEIVGVVRNGEDRASDGVERLGKRLEEVLGRLGMVLERVEGLERKIGEGACRCGNDNGKSAGDGQAGRRLGKEKDSKGSLAPHRRAASSNTTSTTTGKDNNNTTMTTGGAYQTDRHHASTSANTNRRSNTITTPSPSGYSTAPGTRTEDVSTRRNLYTDIGRHKAPEPDLNQHPAFQHGAPSGGWGFGGQAQMGFEGYGVAEGQAQNQNQNQGQNQGRGGWQSGFVDERGPVVFQAPSWSNGSWYRQAYGQ